MAARGIRNNNPGNIEYGPWARAHGATGSDGRFAMFATPEDGIAAIYALQGVYENQHNLSSIQDRISRWAPSADNNNVSAYVNAIKNTMGIGADEPFSIFDPTLGPRFISAMIRHENGRQPYTDQQISSAQSAAPGTRTNRGLTRSSIRAVQKALNAGGFVGADGQPLKVDGIRGDNTNAAIQAALSAGVTSGSSRNQIRGFQAALRANGVTDKAGNPLRIDGIYGQRTTQAAAKYQTSIRGEGWANDLLSTFTAPFQRDARLPQERPARPEDVPFTPRPRPVQPQDVPLQGIGKASIPGIPSANATGELRPPSLPLSGTGSASVPQVPSAAAYGSLGVSPAERIRRGFEAVRGGDLIAGPQAVASAPLPQPVAPLSGTAAGNVPTVPSASTFGAFPDPRLALSGSAETPWRPGANVTAPPSDRLTIDLKRNYPTPSMALQQAAVNEALRRSGEQGAFRAGSAVEAPPSDRLSIDMAIPQDRISTPLAKKVFQKQDELRAQRDNARRSISDMVRGNTPASLSPSSYVNDLASPFDTPGQQAITSGFGVPQRIGQAFDTAWPPQVPRQTANRPTPAQRIQRAFDAAAQGSDLVAGGALTPRPVATRTYPGLQQNAPLDLQPAIGFSGPRPPRVPTPAAPAYPFNPDTGEEWTGQTQKPATTMRSPTPQQMRAGLETAVKAGIMRSLFGGPVQNALAQPRDMQIAAFNAQPGSSFGPNQAQFFYQRTKQAAANTPAVASESYARSPTVPGTLTGERLSGWSSSLPSFQSGGHTYVELGNGVRVQI